MITRATATSVNSQIHKADDFEVVTMSHLFITTKTSTARKTKDQLKDQHKLFDQWTGGKCVNPCVELMGDFVSLLVNTRFLIYAEIIKY